MIAQAVSLLLSIPATVSIACACLNLGMALLTATIGRRAGWRELRAFSWIAFTSTAFNLCNSVVTMSHLDDATLTWGSRASLAVGACHGAGWIAYMAASERRALLRWEKVLLAAIAVIAALSLTPDAVISSEVRSHEVPWLSAVYRDAVPTVLGEVVFALLVALLVLPFVYFLRQWRRGEPLARGFALGLTLLILTGANDALAGAGVVETPYLLDLGFLGVVAAAGGSMVHRFAATARDLDALAGKLERLVDERTRALAEAQGALVRAEKLAAVGGLAAGVAHEINNPSAAVLANLSYLREPLENGEPLPDDARECIDESIQSMQRIARIVRQLLDAGRVAGGVQRPVAPVEVGRAVRASLGNARLALQRCDVVDRVPPGSFALADEDLLVQVLTNVIANAAQAAEAAHERGRVTLALERDGERVRVLVSDDGPGIAPEVEARLFEPFFTTKGVGRGTGLGLAVSLGLMRAQGGDLRVVATSKAGTTLALELPWAPAPDAAHAAAAAHGPVAAKGALRLLVVDDDPLVLDALRRSLGAWFRVETCATVDEAVAALERSPPFDVLLSDVIMPDGGGERLLAELEAKHSPLANRALFMTAGAVTPAAQAFVDRHAGRVLHKPVVPTELLALASSMTRVEARSGA